MPRYYCDYCDTYLTHDSPSVRKQHNQGYKHKANVRNYYQQFEEQQTQSLIDQKVKEHLGQHLGGGGYMLAPGQYRPPLRPLQLPVPGSNPATNMPPVMRPPMGTNPGYVMPQGYRPPVASIPQSNGLPPPPAVPPLNRPPGVNPANGSLPSSAPPHAMYQQPSTSGYNYTPPTSVAGGYSHQQTNMTSAPGYGSTTPGTGLVSAPGSNPSYGQ